MRPNPQDNLNGFVIGHSLLECYQIFINYCYNLTLKLNYKVKEELSIANISVCRFKNLIIVLRIFIILTRSYLLNILLLLSLFLRNLLLLSLFLLLLFLIFVSVQTIYVTEVLLFLVLEFLLSSLA